MDREEAQRIYDAAANAGACSGNLGAAKRYLDADDIEGFERVCRGSVAWLAWQRLRYAMTSGVAETWHDNGGSLMEEYTYVDGAQHGVYRSWHDNGQLWVEGTFVKGVRHGAYKEWRANGQLYAAGAFEGDVIQ